jgi:hypothetical protein
MPCLAMHPIQDLFLESFSYVLQFDMHFYMHSYLDKKIYSCKKWVLQTAIAGTAGDYPNTTIEEDATALMVGYTPCGTLEEHCQTHHFQRIQACSFSTSSLWPQQRPSLSSLGLWWHPQSRYGTSWGIEPDGLTVGS